MSAAGGFAWDEDERGGHGLRPGGPSGGVGAGRKGGRHGGPKEPASDADGMPFGGRTVRGVVVSVRDDSGFGFVKPDPSSTMTRSDVFFHLASSLAEGTFPDEIRPGTPVDFMIVHSRDEKPRAAQMRKASLVGLSGEARIGAGPILNPLGLGDAMHSLRPPEFRPPHLVGEMQPSGLLYPGSGRGGGEGGGGMGSSMGGGMGGGMGGAGGSGSMGGNMGGGMGGGMRQQQSVRDYGGRGGGRGKGGRGGRGGRGNTGGGPGGGEKDKRKALLLLLRAKDEAMVGVDACRSDFVINSFAPLVAIVALLLLVSFLVLGRSHCTRFLGPVAPPSLAFLCLNGLSDCFEVRRDRALCPAPPSIPHSLLLLDRPRSPPPLPYLFR
jgi:cold shock CspA family protein